MCMIAEASDTGTDAATDRQASHTRRPRTAALTSSGGAKIQGAKAGDTYLPQVRSIPLRHCLPCLLVAVQASQLF